MNRHSVLVMTLCAFAAISTGCANIQKGDPARSAELKKFDKKAATGQIYVCRNNSIFGMAIRPDIEVDDKPIGTIATGTFAYMELPPGNHVIVAKTNEHDSKIDFTITATEQKFFETWIVPGVLSGRGVIDEAELEVGKACVSRGELVEAVRN